jgi:hypothetical protein
MGTSAFAPSPAVLVETGCEEFIQKPVNRLALNLLLARSVNIKITTPATLLQSALPKLDGFHLLYAEDSLPNQKIVKRMLEKAGAKCTLVDDGKAAVEAALNNPKMFDCILMVGLSVELIRVLTCVFAVLFLLLGTDGVFLLYSHICCFSDINISFLAKRASLERKTVVQR